MAAVIALHLGYMLAGTVAAVLTVIGLLLCWKGRRRIVFGAANLKVVVACCRLWGSRE